MRHMDWVYVVLFVVVLAPRGLLTETRDREEKILSRPKRYIVFPQGASFSGSFCMSFKTLTDDDIYTGGMNLGISYKLPNTTLRDKDETEPPPVAHRRHRRELFNKMELVFNSVGIDGRACMLRTLCEASQRLIPRESLLSEAMRILLTLPLERVRRYEPDEHHQYDEAHRRGRDDQDCRAIFPNCPMSFLDMFLSH